MPEILKEADPASAHAAVSHVPFATGTAITVDGGHPLGAA